METITNFNEIINKSFNETIQQIIPDIDIKNMVNNKLPNQSLYMKKQKITCNDQSKIYYSRNNPKFGKLNEFIFNNVTLKSLDYAYYNYLLYKNTFTDNFHIVFGNVLNKFELGVKHTIISRGFPIYLAGEISKEKNSNGKDIIKYNFNSSNMRIKNFRKKIYKYLNENKHKILNFEDIILKYKLDKHENEDFISKNEQIIAIRLFFEDFMRSFTDEILKKISGYNKCEFILEFYVSEDEVYTISKDPNHKIGLHKWYFNKDGQKIDIETCDDNNECYDETIIKKINKMQNTIGENIGGLCVIDYDADKCPHDNDVNIYDILDESFIQLIYQLPLLKRDKCKNERLANCNWKMADKSLIDRIYVLLKQNNIDETQDIKHYFSIWFSRYINVNYNKLSIYVYYYNIGDPINILSCHDKLILKNEVLLIKLLFYYYLRLVIPINYENCKIKILDKIVTRSYKLILNSKEFFLTFTNQYIPVIDFTNIYYDYNNSNKIYDNNALININEIIFDNIFKIPHNPFMLIIIDNINEIIPSPISSINYKKKYLKYKSKYLQINNKNY